MKKYLFPFALALALASCNETIPVGSDVLPGSDYPDNFFTDTITLVSRTVREDSLRTDKLFISQLGYAEDPVFGSTTASMVIGFRTPAFGLNADLLDTVGGYFLDSVVLALAVNGIYGDTNQRMSLTVYKLAQPLSAEEIYYSTTRVPTGLSVAGRKENFYPPVRREYSEDSVYTDLGAQIRIPLRPFFGQSLLNIIGTDQMLASDLFRQYMPGLVIVPDMQSSGIVEIDMLTNPAATNRTTALEDTRIHLYYRNAAGEKLSLMFPGVVTDGGVNLFEHDYAGTNVETALNASNPGGDPVNYIQGLAGVKTKVEFPYLSALPANAAVLKAELVITRLKDGSEDDWPAPDRLFALQVGDEGENGTISDYSFPAGHTGGFSREVTLPGGEEALQYRINISDYMQRLLKGDEPNNGVYLTTYANQISTVAAINSTDLIPDRIVVGGGNNTQENYRMKLHLTYTILE